MVEVTVWEEARVGQVCVHVHDLPMLKYTRSYLLLVSNSDPHRPDRTYLSLSNVCARPVVIHIERYKTKRSDI